MKTYFLIIYRINILVNSKIDISMKNRIKTKKRGIMSLGIDKVGWKGYEHDTR